MNGEDQLKTAAQCLEEAKKVVVILPPEPSLDQVIAALSLHDALESSGKTSQIGCDTPINLDQKITGQEKIKDTIGSRNLIISFDYNESDLDKVDYDIREDGRFYLVVKPKENSPIPDSSNVKFTYSGVEAELAIVFGINSLEELGKIYSEEKDFLDKTKILSVNISPRPSSFSATNLHTQSNSYVELVASIIEKTKLELSQDSASNLIFGIFEATKNLTSSKATADTFGSISYLMKLGGRLPNQQSHIGRLSQPAFFDSPFAPRDDAETSSDDQPVPSDWKRPKIFRAGEHPAIR